MKDLDEKDWSRKASSLLKGFLCGLDHMHRMKHRNHDHTFVHRDIKVGLCFTYFMKCRS